MKKILAIVLTLVIALSFAACGSSSTQPAATAAPAAEPAAEPAEETAAEPVTVRIGLTGAVYEPIWDVVKEKLAPEGINLEYVQFNNFSLPNNALNNGEIEINAFQHHAFFNNDTSSNGYDLTAIGDTYIVAMGIFSDKLTDLSELKDGDVVGVPNDVTNEGRALKLLESAGVIVIDPEAGNSPTINDITEYKVQVKFQEVDANLVPSILPDVAVAVVNGNYAADAGLKAADALYMENEYADNSYYCLIAVRSEDADNPIYQRIVEAYQCDEVIDVYNSQFAGLFTPTWKLG
ncbi:MAG: MetQ/NlpA family ABC transporter substrate-binding protein [Oscillospiraceae bacterium]|nr:MetQ/NlpA family ABC transporter substrate-binding protein [Oscillospiraceae bacterium]